MSESRNKISGFAAGVTVVALFSGFTLMSRLGATHDFSPGDLAALRFGVGGLVLAPILLVHGLGHVRIHQAILLALFGGGGFALLAYNGLAAAPAAHGAVLMHGALPLFGVLAGVLLLSETISFKKLAGIALILAGVVTIAGVAANGSTSSDLLMGDIMLLAASCCWAMFGGLAKRWKISPTATTILIAPISAILFFPPYLLFGDVGLHRVDLGELLLQGGFQGLLMGVASPYIYTYAVTRLGATETAVLTAAVPVATTLGALFLLNEVAGPDTWLGVALATVGMTTVFIPLTWFSCRRRSTA